MRVLGIQIDGPFLLTATVERKRGRVKIQELRSCSLSDSTYVKELYTPSFSGKISGIIPSSSFIIKHLNVKLPNNRHLEEALAFQAEGSCHFNPEEVLLIPHIIDQKKQTTDALLFIVNRSSIRETLVELEKLHLHPDSISASVQGLVHYIKSKAPDLKDLFLIHLGIKEWSCIGIENGHLKKMYSILGGNEALLLALWEDRKKILLQKEVEGIAKQIDLLQLKSHFNPNLSKKLAEMRLELTKAIFSFQRESKANSYFFTGFTDTFVHYTEFLSEPFQEAIQSKLNLSIAKDELKYAIPIGVAIEQSTKNPLQFRREEFFPRKNWVQAGLYAVALMLFSFGLSLFFVWGGKKIFSSRKLEKIQKLQAILETTDPQLKEQLFSQKTENIFYRWEETVDLYGKEYPFISKAPKVVEVLDWMQKHPVLKQLKQEGSSLFIQDVSYELIQYPHLGALDEPYRTKVEIEFETESPLNARRLHQALLKGDELVDSTQEVGWEAIDSNRYRTSFFLKNRSPYDS